jgi:UDP-glucose 4-epimerase
MTKKHGSLNKVLVTGNEGFIGKHLTKALGKEATGWDIRKGQDIFAASFEDEVAKVDALVHLAAKTSVEESLFDPGYYYTQNVFGTIRAITLAIKYGLKRFIYASSAAVYDESDKPVSERFKINPVSPYGASKVAAEAFLQVYQDNIPIKVLRIFNVFGPDQNSDYAGVVTKFIEDLDNKELTIYGDGEQSRDFVNVSDVVAVIQAALETEDESYQVYNIGSGISTTVNRLAEMFNDVYPEKLEIKHAEERREIFYSCANIEKAIKELGYKPATNLRDDLQELIIK